jgi:hypothetical protein
VGAILLGELTTASGPVQLTAAAVEDTFSRQEDAFVAAVAGLLPSVLLGPRFDGNGHVALRILDTSLPMLASVLEFKAAAGVEILALVVPVAAGAKVFVACDLVASLRWVDIANMRAFFALPQPTRSAQRDGWIARLKAVPSNKRPNGLDLSASNLSKLASPILRLLTAALADKTIPVSGVNQPSKGFRGGQTHGVTLPLFQYPLEEPGCYLRVIAGREGVLESINAYDQGAGISIGPIQFNAQRAAILKFIRALGDNDGPLFASTLGTEGWKTSQSNGISEVTVIDASGNAATLRGDATRREVGRTVAFMQSKDPSKGNFADIDATWRKRIANLFRDAIVWPHVQVLVESISSQWLEDGLAIVDGSIAPIDRKRPDRDAFVLRALLLSAYVRFSASLKPLLRALQPFPTPATKLDAVQKVLRDSKTTWPELSLARRKTLADRLDAQHDDAVAVWETIIKLADASGMPATIAPAARALMAMPIMIADEDLDLHDGIARGFVRRAARRSAIPLDKSVAVPEFNKSTSATILRPLLTASASATAIAWNVARHPQISGVSVDEVAAALRSYVDFAAVEEALGATWGNGIDAVFVEAVHQFQCKVFADPGDHDGRAGEASLDALGFFFGRPGLNGVDIANATAQAYLDRPKISAALARASDNPKGPFAITAGNWFRQMVQATFLGQKFSNGIHAALVRRLRLAERHLLSLAAYRGMTPVQLGAALGIREPHKGSRPTATTGSMHTMGLATDINYVGNPWLKGTQFTAVLRRSVLFIDGAKIGPGKASVLFFSLTGLPTADIYDTLSSWNAAFKAYLALLEHPSDVTVRLTAHRVNGTQGIFESAAETVQDAAKRWRNMIAADLQSLDSADGFSSRDPRNGFLDLHRDLVTALRDRGCLAWGATDFGPGDDGSGDVMHFDCRNTGIGRVVNRGFKPSERLCP